MPITASARKAMYQSRKRYHKNRVQKVAVKRALHDAHKMIKAGKGKEVATQLPQLYKMIDKATKRHIFHRNNAAHKKSALAKAVGAQKA